MQKDKTITINNKEIDLNTYFDTLGRMEHSNNYTAEIEVMGYLELGHIINSLISVCRSAIENETLPPDPIETTRVLEIAQNLIPIAELELLDKISPF